MIEILIFPDSSGNAVTPAYFNVATTSFMLNRKLIALESYSIIDVPVSPISPGIATLSAAQFKQSALTLLREPGNGVLGGDFYKNIPMEVLRRGIRIDGPGGQINTAGQIWRCEPTEISWHDSFIQVGSGFAIQGKMPVSALFMATYLLPVQDPQPYSYIKLKKHH